MKNQNHWNSWIQTFFLIVVFAFSHISHAQQDSLQVEELPEDKTPALTGVKPQEESDACKAIEAALTAVPPKLKRPPRDRAYYEYQIQMNEPIAGNTEFDEKTYDALSDAESVSLRAKWQRQSELTEKIRVLKADLLDAKNLYNNQSLIAELQAKLDAASTELEALDNDPGSLPLKRMQAAKDVLEAKRALTLLVLWQEFENISKGASLAETQKDQELDSVKAEFQKVQAQFNQQVQALKQQPDRSDATLQKARALKDQTAATLGGLKTRLLKYECWPEVQNYIVNPIESTLFRLNRWKVSAFDFPTDEQIPEDLGGIEEIPEDGENPVDQKKGPVTGSQWILESVTQSPATPPQGWSYSSGSASLQIYNGDRASFTWTPPPQQIDSNGFTISMSAQGNPAAPNGRLAALIGVSTSGLQSDTPSDEWSAYAKSDSGPSSAQKSVTFKPGGSYSDIEVNINIQWAIKFTYKYRRAN